LKSFARVCEDCRAEGARFSYPVELLVSRALIAKGDPEQAIAAASEALEKAPGLPDILDALWWALDSAGRVQEAIDVAKELQEIAGERADHLDYNLGYMSAKLGHLVDAIVYYRSAIQRDSTNWRAHENLALMFLGLRQLEDAKSSWRGYEDAFKQWIKRVEAEPFYCEGTTRVPSDVAVALLVENLDRKSEKFARLLVFSSKGSATGSFLQDLLDLNSTEPPFLGAELIPPRPIFDIEALLTEMQSGDPTRDRDAQLQLELERSGDFSGVAAALKKELPFWNQIPVEARRSLLEGERRIQSKSAADFAPYLMAFAKALEISLAQVVFEQFRTRFELEYEVRSLTQVDMSKKRSLETVVRYLQREKKLELGTMIVILDLCTGKTARRFEFMGAFRDFIQKSDTFCDVLERNFRTSAAELASKYRNPAVHAEPAELEEAEAARVSALNLMWAVFASGQMSQNSADIE
jgi:tetratricopeptide (TPR) repeat protein